ncbi:MAG: apolipoprotein N-acyltransferase, partial [Flavobacteriaceae bacterium]
LIFYIFKIWLAEKRFLVKTSVVVLGLIAVPMTISLFKYHQFDEKPMGKVRVMMLQPNLDPYHEKYQKDSLQIVQELFSLAENSSKIDFYLSPETSFPGSPSIIRISVTGFG